jgi:hypothetical protein
MESFHEWLNNEGIQKLNSILEELKETKPQKNIKGSDQKQLKNYFESKKPNKHGKTVAELELATIIRQLNKKSYKFRTFISGIKSSKKIRKDYDKKQPKTFVFLKNEWKPRIITRDCARDYCTQKLVLAYLTDRFTHSRLSYAYQSGRSAVQAIKELKNKLEVNEDYNRLLTFDIQKFFDSIPHDVMLNKIQQYFPNDEPLKSVLTSYLESKCFTPDSSPVSVDFKTITNQKETYRQLTKLQKAEFSPTRTEGIYQGGVLSGFLANLVLHDLDIMMEKEEDIIYARYADDFLIVCSNKSGKEKGDLLKEKVAEYCNSNRLDLSTPKCKDEPISRDKAMEFLGYKLYRDVNKPSKIIIGLKEANYRKIEERFSVYKHEERFYKVTRSGNCLPLNNKNYLNWYPSLSQHYTKILSEISLIKPEAWILYCRFDSNYGKVLSYWIKLLKSQIKRKKTLIESLFPKWIEINDNSIDVKNEIDKLLNGKKGSSSFCWFSYFQLVNDSEQLDALSKTLRLRVKGIENHLGISVINRKADFKKAINKKTKTLHLQNRSTP